MMQVFISLLVLMFCFPAQAAETITIENAYALQTAAAQKNGAVFMTISNTGENDDQITAASSDIAERVELHTHLMDDGIMMMRKVDFYDLPAKDNAVLQPMGHHIMLMNLKTQLRAGDVFPLTLSFANRADITVNVTVKSPGE
jgi:copper(I)-binding protein